jgi:5-methylcytosine-specific restriction endonuclease McrA
MSEAIKPCRACGEVDRYTSGKCKPCSRKRVSKYYEANREKMNEDSRKWRQANHQKVVERDREYYEANLDKVNYRGRKWYKDNYERALENNRKWKQSNPDKLREYDQNRRALKKGNGGTLSKDIVQTLMNLQKGKCACCNKSLKDGYHLDHIMPIALGGKNSDDNVQLLTPKCNLSKGAKHPIDYMRVKGRLI